MSFLFFSQGLNNNLNPKSAKANLNSPKISGEYPVFLESSQRPARFSQGFQSRLATPAALAVLPLHPSVAFTTDSMAGSYPRSRVRHPSASWLRRREEPIRASCYQGDVMTPHLRSPEERRHWPASGESRRLGGTRYAGWVVCGARSLFCFSHIS